MQGDVQSREMWVQVSCLRLGTNMVVGELYWYVLGVQEEQDKLGASATEKGGKKGGEKKAPT